MSPIRMSKLESGLRAVLALREAFNRHDTAAMLALVSEDCVMEDSAPPPDGGVHAGKEALGRHWEELFRRLPEVRMEVEEAYGMGARCILRWKCAWRGPQGESRHIRGVDIFRVEEGLICEQLRYVKGWDADGRGERPQER